jgi:hypothetical protein
LRLDRLTWSEADQGKDDEHAASPMEDMTCAGHGTISSWVMMVEMRGERMWAKQSARSPHVLDNRTLCPMAAMRSQ